MSTRQSVSLGILLGSLVLSAGLEAQGVPGTWAEEGPRLQVAETPAARLADRLESPPLVRMATALVAEPDRVEELAAYNLEGNLPLQIGIERALAEPIEVVLSEEMLGRPLPGPHAGGVADVASGERLAWAGRIEVEGAYGVRILLADAVLPEGTRVWTYGEDRRLRGPVGRGQVTESRLWTPTAFGEVVHLEIDVPLEAIDAGERVAVRLVRVAEIFRLDERGVPRPDGPRLEPKGHTTLPDCLVDGMCKDSGDLSFIEDYRKAVANLLFQKDGFTFTCTAGLLNTADGPAPYLLTANHCFDTQASASSLDAFWDHTTDACDGTDPGLGGVPSTSGSTLLATWPETDTTLVEITDTPLPSGRYHLGWTVEELAHGTTLHRLHNPSDDAQHYSRSTVDHTGPIECEGFERPRFLYSELQEGGEVGGSSGSVVVIDAAGGQVVGQLLGACGTDVGDACNFDDNRTVDGAFRHSFPRLRPFLDPGGAAADEALSIADFSLGGGQSVTRQIECGQNVSGDAYAFTFEGTVSGVSGSSTLAADLRLQLTGPSGSGYDVGGFDNLANTWDFQGPGSGDDGTYTSTHGWVFASGGDGTTLCDGTWTAELTNDWSSGDTMSWSGVSITFHKFQSGCPFDDHLVLPSQTVTGTETFEACRSITAGSGGFEVASTGDVTFRAGESIVLESGFSVASGGSFVAEIDPSLAP